jgi:hypothetical protein
LNIETIEKTSQNYIHSPCQNQGHTMSYHMVTWHGHTTILQDHWYWLRTIPI